MEGLQKCEGHEKMPAMMEANQGYAHQWPRVLMVNPALMNAMPAMTKHELDGHPELGTADKPLVDALATKTQRRCRPTLVNPTQWHSASIAQE